MDLRRAHLRRADLRWGLAGSLPLAVLLAGCPGVLEDPDRFLTTIEGCAVDPVEDILGSGSCAGNSCHNASDQAAGLDLASEDIESRLVDVVSLSCNDRPFIDSSDINNSALLLKIEGATPADCGSPMPLVGSLSSSEQQCLRAWIETLVGGASDDGGVGTADGGL